MPGPSAGAIPLLRATNIQPGKLDYVDPVWIPRELVKPVQELKVGDLVVASSSGSLSVVGKNARVLEERKATFGAFCTVIRPVNVEGRFLALWLESPTVRQLWSDKARGSNINNLKSSDLSGTEIPVPPLNVQMRIVETLEDHLSRLDNAVSDLKASSLQLKTYSRSLAHDKLTGKGRDCSSWSELTLGDIATWSSGGTPSSKTPPYYGGDIPWAVIGDLTEGPVETTAQSITTLGLEKSSAKVQPTGTIMLAMYGASIGRTGIASIPMATNQAIACAQINETLITHAYLLRFLQNQKDDFVAAGQGGAQPNISQGIIKTWAISLPPLQAQNEISQAIDIEVERVGRLSEMIQMQIDAAETLRRSLLHSAFTGQLSNEDSHD
jgi:type I restriction enzyme S subunit